MCRAIQLRLRQTVGDRLESAPLPQANDTTGHIQVAVLECVDAMGQLQAVMTRGCTWRQPFRVVCRAVLKSPASAAARPA